MEENSGTPHEHDNLPFEFKALPVDDSLREANWKAVEAAILQPVEEAPVRKVHFGQVFMAAASIFLVVFGLWYISTKTGKPQMSLEKTAYGEMKSILLPDSSVVILNANSSLRLSQQWTDESSREVWLEGEAYFQVQKKRSTRQKFVVHTKQVDVEVLGTRFNINARRQQSIVSLEEGKVQLLVHTVAQAAPVKENAMVMRPGQVVVVNDVKEPKVNEERDVTTHSGWSRNEFHFDNTSLSEIARIIEDTYGYKMEVKDTSFYNRTVSGDLRAANVQELVKVLEVTLKLSMRIENKKIYVTQP